MGENRQPEKAMPVQAGKVVGSHKARTADNIDRRLPKRKPRGRQALDDTARDLARFAKAHRAEKQYAKQLLQIANSAWTLISNMGSDDGPGALERINDAMRRYSDLIEPWAKAIASRMIADVNRRNIQAWDEHAGEIGKNLRKELSTAPTGKAMTEVMKTQVSLIKSLPIDAGNRVHELANRGLTAGARPKTHEDQIAHLGLQPTAKEQARGVVPTEDWIRNRARLIARTEVARTASVLTQVRAEHIGCEQYHWRASQDGNVRPTHKALNGKVFNYADPPISEADGHTKAHPGQVWNCFVGSTQVSLATGIRRIWRAPFQGDFFDVHFGGQVFTATPNHPVLTSRGWIAVCLVQEGDDLVHIPSNDFTAGGKNVNDSVSTFEEIFEALRCAGDGRVNSVLNLDFHGDRANGEIDVISVDELLALHGQSVIEQRLRKFKFSSADSRMMAAIICSGPQVLISATSSRINEFSALQGSAALHSQSIGLRAGSPINASLGKPTNDDLPTYSKSLGHAKLAHSRIVKRANHVAGDSMMPIGLTPAYRESDAMLAQELAKQIGTDANDLGKVGQCHPFEYSLTRVDQVVRRQNEFAHVYTLESWNGWYSITSKHVISKNCRCTAAPIIPLDL